MAAAISGTAGVGLAQVVTYPVDVSSDRFTLYTDPNTGREIKLGGFSGLTAVPGDRTGTLFYVVTDRGPTIDFGATGKGFLVPDHEVSVITVRLLPNGSGKIANVLPLRRPGGEPIHGVPSACHLDEAPIVDLFGNELPHDPDGLDAEGLAILSPGGIFCVSDEYLPSVVLAGPGGQAFLRLVPRGAICGGERVPTLDILPGVYRQRIANRGFEAIAATRDWKLYVALQRPLANPNRAASQASLNIRMLEIDLPRLLTGQSGAIRQLVYITEVNSRQDRVYISDLSSLGGGKLLGSERRSDKVFLLDVAQATDITALEDANGRLASDPNRTLEQLSIAELSALGVVPVAKTLIYSGLTAIDPTLDKVEGLTLSRGRLVVCPDNDFDLLEGSYDTTPATLVFQEPTNFPRIITIGLPPGTVPGGN
jgi:hypothetical protein